MKSVFERLYDSEINFSISTFWDGGYEIKLGDDMNGFKAEAIFKIWADVELWLDAQAILHFPHYAKEYYDI